MSSGVLLSVLSRHRRHASVRTRSQAVRKGRSSFRRDALSFLFCGSTWRYRSSSIPPDAPSRLLVGAPGIARDADGELLPDAEVLAFLLAHLKNLLAARWPRTRANDTKGLAMRPGVASSISGRLNPTRPARDIRSALARHRALRPEGRRPQHHARISAWPIVGEFSIRRRN